MGVEGVGMVEGGMRGGVVVETIHVDMGVGGGTLVDAPLVTFPFICRSCVGSPHV